MTQSDSERMLTATMLALYDSQLRGAAEMHDAPVVTEIGPVLTAVFPARGRCFVTYPPFAMTGPDIDRLIEDVVARASADERVRSIKWKQRSHDPLPELQDRLRRQGFTLVDTETVLVGHVDALIAADPGPPKGYTIERAVTEIALTEAEQLAGRVFGDTPEETIGQQDELLKRWRESPESFEMWVARDPQGNVACSGRVDFVDGTDFAGLWGGACDPAHRGRGLYRALVAERARSARARGKHLIHVDCSNDSRPILERAGLRPITTVTSAVWNRTLPRGRWS